ncbi:unnamed protein product [Heterotrigona itama]|uniref:Uncharacterized protein n=1 Tax=Heterotrigona itama TaxID=395501 RepID=A0A6V7H292_9HYME|nr:unnamed protein product [Heterotrigona itama]
MARTVDRSRKLITNLPRDPDNYGRRRKLWTTAVSNNPGQTCHNTCHSVKFKLDCETNRRES